MYPSKERVPYQWIIEDIDGVSQGVVAIVKSDAIDGTYYERICAVHEMARGQGLAILACPAALDKITDPRIKEKLIACVDTTNKEGLSLTKKLGFNSSELRPAPNNHIRVFHIGKKA